MCHGILDKHASLLNAGQTQNEANDPPVQPKKKVLGNKVKVEVDETKTDGKKRGQSKRGGRHNTPTGPSKKPGERG